MDKKDAMIIWRSMSRKQQKNLWLDNCKAGDFTKTWNFGMFSSSTSTVHKALNRQEEECPHCGKEDDGILR